MNASPNSPIEHSQATRLISESVIQRLRVTGEFSIKQLSIVQKELDRYFHGVCDTDWSFFDLPPGTEVGNYVLETLIGEGGAAQVYRARLKASPDQSVALKVIKNVCSTDRFRREMELVQRLAHPNVVISYEVGECHGILYIAMEELSGPDLHEHVRQFGPIPWRQSISLILDAVHGLRHAHQRGLIHRDVKPGNLMFDAGRIKVTDLGLAALTSDSIDDRSKTFRTRLEMVGGTPEFMAPEQARSLASATALSDIYALGATWFYLLTGNLRIGGESLNEKISSLIHNVDILAVPRSCAPDEVRHVIEKMVAFRPENRYASMDEVDKALTSIIQTGSPDISRHHIEILIVEDDQDDLFLTVEMLKRGNKAVTVHEARTVSQASVMKERFPTIDLVLLDLQLPDTSGIRTVELARAAMGNVPIIVLTGHDDVELGEKCIVAGADDFACKNDLNSHLLERMIFITLSRYTHREFVGGPES